jgi:hypothetical protein
MNLSYLARPRLSHIKAKDIKMKPYTGPTMILGGARLPIFASSCGAATATTKWSPIPPKWPNDTAPRLPFQLEKAVLLFDLWEPRYRYGGQRDAPGLGAARTSSNGIDAANQRLGVHVNR